MKLIEIYDGEDAKVDIKNGIPGKDCSLKKWQSIYKAIDTISIEGHRRCGLCLEYMRCSNCPLEDVSSQNCCKEFDVVMDLLNTLKYAIEKLNLRIYNI